MVTQETCRKGRRREEIKGTGEYIIKDFLSSLPPSLPPSLLLEMS
jgi:hypothetical protein